MVACILIPGGLVFLIAAYWLATTSPEVTLKIDARGGLDAYCREMKRTGDRAKSLQAAGKFYRMFAACLAAIGFASLAVATVEIFFRIFSSPT